MNAGLFRLLNVVRGWGTGLFLSVCAVFCCSCAASASEIRASYASVGGATSVPYGWLDFCSRHADECNVDASAARTVELNGGTLARLSAVNARVNRFIKPVSNFEHWGTMLDHWDYPTDGKGDCKIFALYKRKLLLGMGFPRQALLMTIVRDLNGEGHTILTVKTDKGDLILDNLVGQVRSWDETGYRFVKRQSQENPNVWLSMGDVVGLRQAASY